MAERRGPEGESTPEYDPASENGPASGKDPVSGKDCGTDAVSGNDGVSADRGDASGSGTAGSGRDNGSHGADDRARDAADEGTELIEDHQNSGADAERGVPEQADSHQQSSPRHDSSNEAERGEESATKDETSPEAETAEAGTAEVASAESAGGSSVGEDFAGEGTTGREAAAEERSTVLTFPAGGTGSDEHAQAATEDLVDLDELGDEPVDLAELRSDAALLDALGGTDPDFSTRTRGQTPDLETLLVAWRQDVDAAPIGDLVDTDTAVTTIAEAQRRPWRRLKRRHLVPVASAAAVLMISVTGVGLAARDALPGDMLWGVAQVLYTDHTRTVQAAVSAQSDFQYAEHAWANNKDQDARAALKRGKQQMQAVDREHGLEDLRTTQQSLANRFERGHYQPPRSSASPTTSPPEQLPPSTPSPPSPSQPPSMPPAPPTGTQPSGPPSSSQEPTAPTSTPSETSGGGSSEYPYPSSGTTARNSGSSGLFAPRSQ